MRTTHLEGPQVEVESTSGSFDVHRTGALGRTKFRVPVSRVDMEWTGEMPSFQFGSVCTAIETAAKHPGLPIHVIAQAPRIKGRKTKSKTKATQESHSRFPRRCTGTQRWPLSDFDPHKVHRNTLRPMHVYQTFLANLETYPRCLRYFTWFSCFGNLALWSFRFMWSFVVLLDLWF